MDDPIEILIVDDNAFVRKAIRRLLEQEPRFSVYAEAECAEDALEALHRHLPDVVLLDLSLAEGDSMDLIRTIRCHHPALPILVLTLHQESLFAESALEAGANGYLMKSDAADNLIQAIHQVLCHETYVSELFRKTHRARRHHHVEL